MDKDIKLQSLPTLEERMKCTEVKIDELCREIVSFRQQIVMIRSYVLQCENIVETCIKLQKTQRFFDVMISISWALVILVLVANILRALNII